MIIGFIKDLYRIRHIILELAKRDYKQVHMGSYLGLVWNYLQPMLFVGVLYVVFAIGLRQGGDRYGMPFSIYLLSGMVCWLYVSGNLTSIANVMSSYSFLVKKVDFRLSVLPIVKLLSSLPTHVVLFALLVFLAALSGHPPGWHSLQFVYYYLCSAGLLTGIGWITSTSSLFVKDVKNVIAVITQFGLWLTPIFWAIDRVPEAYRWIVKLNPAYYLVTGYRDSVTGGRFFWERPLESLYFWAVMIIFLYLGMVVYRRLKPHLAEVI